MRCSTVMVTGRGGMLTTASVALLDAGRNRMKMFGSGMAVIFGVSRMQMQDRGTALAASIACARSDQA